MSKIEFWTTTQKAVDNAAAYVGAIFPDEKKPQLVTVQELKQTRSIKQNALLNGPVYKQLIYQTGLTREELHRGPKDNYKNGYIFRYAVKIFTRDDPGYAEMIFTVRDLALSGKKEESFLLAEQIVKLTSTTNFNTKQMAEFITLIVEEARHNGLTINLTTDDDKLLRF